MMKAIWVALIRFRTWIWTMFIGEADSFVIRFAYSRMSYPFFLLRGGRTWLVKLVKVQDLPEYSASASGTRNELMKCVFLTKN